MALILWWSGLPNFSHDLDGKGSIRRIERGGDLKLEESAGREEKVRAHGAADEATKRERHVDCCALPDSEKATDWEHVTAVTRRRYPFVLGHLLAPKALMTGGDLDSLGGFSVCC